MKLIEALRFDAESKIVLAENERGTTLERSCCARVGRLVRWRWPWVRRAVGADDELQAFARAGWIGGVAGRDHPPGRDRGHRGAGNRAGGAVVRP